MFGLMGVARMSGQPGGAFSLLSLFANGEQGAWFDPSDFSTMFQDSAGMTPVTAVEQPVGLILDKRLGLALGSELVTNGDFSDGATGWELETFWSVSGGVATTSGGAGSIKHTYAIQAGKTYKFEFDIVAASGATIQATFDGIETSGEIGTTGHKICYLKASADRNFFLFYANGTGTASITNISVREIAGNHATQATAAARPVVSAPSYINYDGIDDLLATTFPNLGTDCTIARAVPGVGASILTGQTIGVGVRNDATDHAGLVIIDRALTAGETAALTAYLNAKAGV